MSRAPATVPRSGMETLVELWSRLVGLGRRTSIASRRSCPTARDSGGPVAREPHVQERSPAGADRRRDEDRDEESGDGPEGDLASAGGPVKLEWSPQRAPQPEAVGEEERSEAGADGAGRALQNLRGY